MKAIHVIQRYLPAKLSGSEKAFVILCEALAKKTDQEIIVVTSDVDPGEGFYDPRAKRISTAQETINRVEVVRLPVNWLIASYYFIVKKLLSSFGKKPSDQLRMLAFGPHLNSLEETLVAENPDIIHASPMPMSHLYQTWQIATKHKIPLIITPTMHFDDPMFDNQLIYTILADAAGIIAHTEFEKEELVKRGLPAKKVSVIPSSYLSADDFTAGDGAAFRKKYKINDAPMALFIGSKSYDKGTVHLLEAWPKVRKHLPDARLVVAGFPTESWKEGKKGKDMTGVIELDYVDDETKHSALAAANAVCVPSRSESFGMIILEAWAKKKPFLGGSAGATRELIDEDINGYVVDFGDVEVMSQCVAGLLQNTSLATKLGNNGYKKAQEFTEQAIVDKTLELYEQARQRKGSDEHP